MAKAEGEDVLLQKVIEAAKGGGGRSKLYRYMRANFASLSEALDRPDWEAVTAEFAAAGYGQLAPATVRKTWWKVKRDVAKTAKAPAPAAAARPAAPPPPATSEDPPPPRFGPSKPKG